MPVNVDEVEKDDEFYKLFEIYKKFMSGLLTSDQALEMGLKYIEKMQDLGPEMIHQMKDDWIFTIKVNGAPINK
jgi:hypothetical protein